MKTRYGPSLITGKAVYGVTSLGIAGATIRANTATGTNGPGILYNDWDSSADDAKEFRALIISGAPTGTLFYEDGSFTIPAGTADGTYPILYRLFVDGADMGTATATVTISAATTPVISDLSVSFSVNAAISSDLAAGYQLLSAIQSDLSAAFSVGTGLTPVVSDLTASLQLLQSVTSDLAATYALSTAVVSDLIATYAISNGLTAVTSDLSAVSEVLGAVRRDLAAAFTLGNDNVEALPESTAQRRLGASLIRRLKNCRADFTAGSLYGIYLDNLIEAALGTDLMQGRAITLRLLQADVDALGLVPNKGTPVQVVSELEGVTGAFRVDSVERHRQSATIVLTLKKQ